MTQSPKASVIIPSFKRRQLLRRLLQSLASQRSSYPFEVIVVNDDPQDDLSPLELEFSDIPIKVINLSADHGRSIARNTGVRSSTGEILIFLDDDMTVVEDFIEQHIRTHTDPRNAVIGNVLSAPEHARDPLARYIERQGVKKRRPGQPLAPRCFRTGNGSVARQMFYDAGMFDESFRTYGEDLDLGMRLSYQGAIFVYAEGAISYNNQPPDLEDMMAKMREWGRFTLPLFAERHPQLSRDLWVHLAQPIKFGHESPVVSLKKMALRIALSSPLHALARLIYRLKWLGRLLFPVIDFIRVYNYLGAYRQSLKDRTDAGHAG
jgi:glycosyltransferase involved in cell wall biosynthesis